LTTEATDQTVFERAMQDELTEHLGYEKTTQSVSLRTRFGD